MIVFTYPGQGSQQPGMGAPWAEHPSWELVEEASEVVDRDVAELLLKADAEELTMTRNAQLATFVMSMVVLDAVSRIGAEAVAHAGHSLGEYSALTASGAIDFSDALRLVSERGDAMQAAADEQNGTMAALLGLEDEQVDISCRRVAGDVWIANYNAPGQVVIAGVPKDIDQACAVAKEAGAKRAMRLPVGGAFHTPLMASARNRLHKAIGQVEFRSPEQPVYANVDATMHEDAAEWPDLLTAQLCSPVRWRQTLTALQHDGFNTFVELGPGNVLTGLVKRTLADANRANVATPNDLDGLLESLTDKTLTDKTLTDKTLTDKTLTKTPTTKKSLTKKTPAEKLDAENLAIEGEHLFATERLVVSPSAGVFNLAEGCKPGRQVAVGDLLGTVGEQEVVSSFAGEIVGVLAFKGERVTSRQPIAWLRVN